MLSDILLIDDKSGIQNSCEQNPPCRVIAIRPDENEKKKKINDCTQTYGRSKNIICKKNIVKEFPERNMRIADNIKNKKSKTGRNNPHHSAKQKRINFFSLFRICFHFSFFVFRQYRCCLRKHSAGSIFPERGWLHSQSCQSEREQPR